MKYQTTNKELKYAHNLVAAGYCELQNALNYISPTAYTYSKLYGWRADVYHCNGFTIVTGYSTPSHAKDIPYDLCRQIEKGCKDKPNEVREAILHKAITDFLKSA